MTPTATLPTTGAIWRRAAEMAVPALALAIVVVSPLLVWNRLPEPMAVHWGTGGQPDGALPRLADLLTLTLATAAVGWGPLLAARLRMPRVQARILVATALGCSGLFAVLRIETLRANLDATTWTTAGHLTSSTLLWAVLVTTVAGAAGAWLAGDRPAFAPPTSAPSPVAARPGGAPVWVGGATSRLGVFVPLALVAAAALSAWVVPGEARVVLLVVLPLTALATSTLGQTRVVVGPQGLSAGLGWFGWPRLRVPIEEVAAVSVEDVAPMSYGGWGLRFVPGVATAIVIRSGPAIRIERTSGRAFVVTVDDAARAAGVLLSHAETSPAEA